MNDHPDSPHPDGARAEATPPPPASPPNAPAAPPTDSPLDQWAAQSPWRARALPFIVYVLLMIPVGWSRDIAIIAYPVLYTMQCVLVGWLIWRLRRYMPELTLRFHWTVIPAGLGVTGVWIASGHAMERLFPETLASTEPHYFETMSPELRAVSLGLRLLGMSLVVPLLEEPFVRSLLLRATGRARSLGVAAVQIAEDLPLVGERLMRSRLGQWADAQGDVLTRDFHAIPFGALTVTGVTVSTLVFTSYHALRDWPACIACGLVYCGMVWIGGRTGRGLGPVIWAHALTNAALWLWCVTQEDWRFL